jgi:trk system potassium uptake protein TrkA
MKIIVMGCGRVGSQVSLVLSAHGHDVTVIDHDNNAENRLGPNFKGKLLRGLGFDRTVLIEADIEHSDAFAAVSASDNANIVAARTARNIFKVPRVVARLYDPRRAEIYQRLGLMTISTTTWGAERIYELITHADLDVLYTFGRGEVSVVSHEISTLLVGRTSKDITIPGEINLISITRDDVAFIPSSGTTFKEGDIVHLAVLSSAMPRLEEMFGLERRI